MIHYHVWFNLKPEVPEASGLEVVSRYLSQLRDEEMTAGFQLLKNSGKPPRSKLGAYHALVEFTDSQALGSAMKKQAERGIHSGEHGRVVDVVGDFHVEVFEHLPVFQPMEVFQACEI
jgi:hypothetical protein